jgi:hypothetical protein
LRTWKTKVRVSILQQYQLQEHFLCLPSIQDDTASPNAAFQLDPSQLGSGFHLLPTLAVHA